MSKDKLVISHWLGLTMQHFLYSDRACNNMRSECRISLLGLFWLIHLCRDSANIISWLQRVHKNTANCIACWQCAIHPFLQTAILILQLVDFHTWSICFQTYYFCLFKSTNFLDLSSLLLDLRSYPEIFPLSA